jgi:hypothetical protein
MAQHIQLNTKSFYGNFRKDLKEWVNATFFDTADVRLHVKDTWDKQDYWSNPRNMQTLFDDSNAGPVPWTEPMRLYIKDNKLSSYEQMKKKFESRELDSNDWEVLKARALEIQQHAVDTGKPLYSAWRGYIGPAKPKPLPEARANAPIGSAKPVPPAAGAAKKVKPAPSAGGAGAGKPRKSAGQNIAQPADEGVAPPAALAAAAVAAAQGPAPPAAAPAAVVNIVPGSSIPHMVENRHVEMLQHIGYAFACIDTDKKKIDGYLYVPASDRDAFIEATRQCVSYETFTMYHAAPLEVHGNVARVFTNSYRRDLIYENYSLGMYDKVILPANLKPTGDRQLDQYAIPCDCLEMYAKFAANTFQLKLNDIVCKKDIISTMEKFKSYPHVEMVNDYMFLIHDFKSATNVDAKRRRHAQFMKLPNGFPQVEYFQQLKDEHKTYLCAGGYSFRNKSLVTEASFVEMLDLYSELLPDWSTRKEYEEKRKLLMSGGQLLDTHQITQFAEFEKTHGNFDELFAKHGMQKLFARYETPYTMYRGTKNAFSSPQPPPPEPIQEFLVDPVPLETEEKIKLSVFIADTLEKTQGAKNNAGAYASYAEDLVQKITRCIPSPDDEFKMETIVHHYDFSATGCPVITNAYIHALQRSYYRVDKARKGEVLFEAIVQAFDHSIAAARQPRPYSKQGGKRVAIELDQASGGRAASPLPPSGEGRGSPSVSPERAGADGSPSVSPERVGAAGSPSVPPATAEAAGSPAAAPPKRKRAGSRAGSMAREMAYLREDDTGNIIEDGRGRSRTPRTFYDGTGHTKLANDGGKKARKDRA